MAAFNRYDKFIEGGTMKLVPFIEIPKKDSDQYVEFIRGVSRLDLISYQFYDDPNYGWLILQANPEVGSYEFKIPSKTILRIPYPLSTTLIQYNNDIEIYDKLYGIN